MLLGVKVLKNTIWLLSQTIMSIIVIILKNVAQLMKTVTTGKNIRSKKFN